MEEFSEEGAATKIRRDPPPVDDPPPSSTAKKLCLRDDEAGCFKEFAITFDGTPSLAEAEAIIVRTVRSRTVSRDEQ